MFSASLDKHDRHQVNVQLPNRIAMELGAGDPFSWTASIEYYKSRTRSSRPPPLCGSVLVGEDID